MINGTAVALACSRSGWLAVASTCAAGLSSPSGASQYCGARFRQMSADSLVEASAAGGNVDLVRHETDGLLVPPLDPVGWARAIERLLGDAPLAASLGARARATARETFSLDRTVERTIELYRSLCPGAVLAPAAPFR
jgi:hypothetical protein